MMEEFHQVHTQCSDSKEHDWPTLSSGHGLVEKGLGTVLAAYSLWEASQVRAKLPQDIWIPQEKKKGKGLF